MSRPRSNVNVVCQNHFCKYYRKENGRSITKSGVYKTGHQRYLCHHCNAYFMETKGTPLYRKHMTEKDIVNICRHLVEKNGVRSIERITGHHRDTIGRLLTDIAEHADTMSEYLIKNLKLSPMECDEFWTFVKNKRGLTPKSEMALKSAMHGYTHT